MSLLDSGDEMAIVGSCIAPGSARTVPQYVSMLANFHMIRAPDTLLTVDTAESRPDLACISAKPQPLGSGAASDRRRLSIRCA